MPEILSKLQKTSYRGIPFFYQGSSEDRGIKVADHIYPGSSNFNREQLGRKPRSITMEAKVLFQNRDALDNALETEGPGLLSHPMYGTLTVKVGDFTKSDTKDELGFYAYSINFAVELGALVPELEGIGRSIINKARASVLDAVVTFIKNTFSL